MSNKLLVVISGPTASGKTQIAIEIAQHYKTSIVSADSRQVYAEMNIGVGKPGPAQLDTVPHHLISHASIHHPYSAGHYTTDALQVIYTLFASNDIVVLTGGTGLYIKSIIEGFDAMPEVPAKVTDHWTKVWEKEGLQPLILALQELDPDYLAVVDQENAARLIRAVAVSDFSGKPFSAFRKGEKAERLFNVLPIALEWPRKELYRRINERVTSMIEAGWLDEAKDLYPYRHLKALQTLGYKELFEVLEGNMELEDAIPLIQQSTRRYAKRQMTWFRNQGNWHWMPPDDAEVITRFIDEFRDGSTMKQ